MKKIKNVFLILPVLALVVMAMPAHAQVMGGNMMKQVATDTTGVTPANPSATAEDEAKGRAIWEKLQSKELTCKDLKDDDFDVLGDFYMGNMMGSNHDAMNKTMAERLGDAGEKQMHIAMGKRMSGCDTSAAYPQGSDYFMPMMNHAHEGGLNALPAGDIEGQRGSMMQQEYGHRYGSREEGPFKVLGFMVGLAALAFFGTGSMYFWKQVKKK